MTALLAIGSAIMAYHVVSCVLAISKAYIKHKGNK